MFPMIAGMMGLKPDKTAFYAAMGATLLSFVVARQWIFSDQGHFVALVSTLTNGLVFFGVHFYRHKGWAVVRS